MKKNHFFIISLAFITLNFSCKREEKIFVGKIIEGDFNGDGYNEIASVNLMKTNKDSTCEYSIIFSDLSIKKIDLINKCKKIQLINEGDLNEDNADDISISLEENKITPISNMQTIGFKNNKWEKIIEFFSIYAGRDTLNSKKLQNLVSKKGKSIVYYTYGESFKFDENYKPLDTTRIKKVIKINKPMLSEL